MTTIINKIKWIIVYIIFRWKINRIRIHNHKLEKLGSKYGGWIVPVDILDKNSICYCVGVGEDITFDLELIKRFDCQVYAFDQHLEQ